MLIIDKLIRPEMCWNATEFEKNILLERNFGNGCRGDRTADGVGTTLPKSPRSSLRFDYLLAKFTAPAIQSTH